MFFNRKFNAFSLVELMMILLVASLITAALFPVVTKKHFRLPTLVNHGAYLCYYENGKLKEAKWAGKMKTKMIIPPRETDNCVFVPPKKAGYFEISVIGGGGGGGDAGYTGGDWISSIVETEMSPFQRSEEELKEHGITKSEFLRYAGWVMGYANSIGSGSGGDIGYMYRTDTDHSQCLEYVTKEVDETKTVSTCEAVWANGKCTFYSCEEVEECTSEPYNTTCDYKTPVVCEKRAETKTEVVKTGRQICANYETYEKTPARDVDMCCMARNGSCLDATYECGDGSSGSYDMTTGVREIHTGKKHYDPVTDQRCTDWRDETKTVVTGGECLETSGGEWKTKPCTKYNTSCKTVTKKTEEGTGTSQAACKSGASTTVVTGHHTEETSTCVAGQLHEWTTYEYSHSTQSGESGGSGASCYSTERHGDLGLNGSGTSTIYSSDVKNGSDVDYYSPYPTKFYLQEMIAGFGTASCYPRLEGAQSCNGKPSYAFYDITGGAESVYNSGSTLVKAYSASVGGNGGKRGIRAGDTVDPYWDEAISPSRVAEDGYCSGASSTSYPSCSGSGDYGYCLVHHYKPSVAETGGMYKYEFGRDTNYLGYGEPGQPGEFKTTIVRTLKGVDTTIKVGRGGSAAALNSGGKGTAGSKTSFGDIISAAGGEGGKGKQTLTSEELPVYDKDRYDKESKCFYYSQAFAKKADGSYLKADDERVISTKSLTYGQIRQKLDEEPDYCNGLINNQGNYKFFRVSTNDAAQKYPTPVGIFSSFLNLAFKNLTGSDDNPLEKFTKSGRGGKAGAVEHRCWAGRGEVIFENVYMKSSVYPDQTTANAHGSSLFVPKNCRIDYSNIPAGPGTDGAVLIKW